MRMPSAWVMRGQVAEAEAGHTADDTEFAEVDEVR